jgi:hypothetical protein
MFAWLLCLQAQQLSELDWARDIAPYFTLPGLIDRVDALLAATCGLRLLPADSPEAAAAAAVGGFSRAQQMQRDVTEQQQQQQDGSVQAWGDNVMHLVLLDTDWQQQQQPLLLGHVFIELVPGWGFPSCCLLQLPTPTASSSTCNSIVTSNSSSTDQQAAMSQPAYTPGSVVVRLPIPTAKPLLGFGQRSSAGPNTSSTTSSSTNSQAVQQQQQPQEQVPLMLPGPAALQALLHELGHALSYLCPAVHLHTSGAETVHHTSSSSSSFGTGNSSDARTPAATNSSHTSNSSSDVPTAIAGAAAGAAASTESPLDASLGPQCCCLLSSPAAGLDVRELSSHLLEHYVRHPASLVVSTLVM